MFLLRLNLIFLLSIFALSPSLQAGDLLGKKEVEETEEDSPPLHKNALLREISRPWTGVLAKLKKQLDSNKNYVIWVLVPPRHPMDMRSAEYFHKFVVATPVSELSISHNMIAWQCHTKEGKLHTGATGSTGEDDDQSKEMLKTGFGLTSFFATFHDGSLNTSSDVSEIVEEEASGEKGIMAVAIEVAQENCEDMLGFLKSFVLHPSKPYTRFGLTLNPEKMQGAGCVTFAATLMKKADVLSNVIPHFYRTVEASRYMLGGNLPLPKYTTAPSWPWLEGRSYSVSLGRVWRDNWGGVENNVSLRIMDPEMMAYSMRTLARIFVKTGGDGSAFENSKYAQRTVVSAEPYSNGMYPERGGLEISYFDINDSFDQQTAMVSQATKEWMRQKGKEGYKIKRISLANQPALLIEKSR